MHVHGSASTTPIHVVTALASADVAIVAGSGVSRFVAAVSEKRIVGSQICEYLLHGGRE